MRKTDKHWRIDPRLIERMRGVKKPHQTETDWVEDALYEKAVREEEAAKADAGRRVA